MIRIFVVLASALLLLQGIAATARADSPTATSEAMVPKHYRKSPPFARQPASERADTDRLPTYTASTRRGAPGKGPYTRSQRLDSEDRMTADLPEERFARFETEAHANGEKSTRDKRKWRGPPGKSVRPLQNW